MFRPGAEKILMTLFFSGTLYECVHLKPVTGFCVVGRALWQGLRIRKKLIFGFSLFQGSETLCVFFQLLSYSSFRFDLSPLSK